MSGFDIVLLRLQNQHLLSPEFKNPAEIVAYLGAVQAQDYAGAKWAIAQRLLNGNDPLIEKAFTGGEIIRTHVLRPTWHFVSPADIRWMLDLTAEKIMHLSAYYHREAGLDSSIFIKSANAITKALEGGKQLDRTELINILNKAGIATNYQRFIHIMMVLELQKLVCSGGRQGKQFTYALFDERVPAAKSLTREEALATLALRYFTSHGPATVYDFAWWSGLTVTDAKSGLETVKSNLISEVFENNIYWFTDNERPGVKTVPAFLLPNYDEYIVSYKDRSAAIESKNVIKADPRGTIFNHTIIINGKVEGIWKAILKKSNMELVIDPFKSFTKKDTRKIELACKNYVKFSGLKNYIITYK